jgi:glycosyltransferase involved in cell wall biosynthesis
VDTEYFTPDRWNSASSRVIVFLGRMDYFPNIDGVNYFVKEIFPIIREKREDAELRIIGSNPAKSVRELRKLPNISVTGHVRDVRPYLKDAAVSIAPLRIARGTQNKILESMAFGIPVVATPEASKGVQAIHGRDLLVADNSQSFAQKVLDLMMNRQLAIVLSEAGRRQVERAHRWSTSMNILDNLLAEASARPRACSPQGNSSRR